MPRGGEYATSLVGGTVGAVAGLPLGGSILLAQPPDDSGFEALGWVALTLAAVAVAAVVGGAVGTAVALRRRGVRLAVVTGVAYVPVAAVLAFTGPGVLAAPAAARWMVVGLDAWHPRTRPEAGVPQRVVLAVALSLSWVSLVVTMAGYPWGGRVGAVWTVWLAAVSAPVALCLVLLRKGMPVVVPAAVLLLSALVAGAGAQVRTADSHPTPARLAQIADSLAVPEGQVVTARIGARTHSPYSGPADRGPGAWMPVRLLVSVPRGVVAPSLPAALVPEPDGSLPRDDVALRVGPVVVPTTADAARAVAGWEASLQRAGWRPVRHDLYWVARPAAQLLSERGGAVFGRGTWLRAAVLPHGDGAVVFLSTRP